MAKQYRVIGIMSGTSCDGLDIALCRFTQKSSGWNYEIERAVTIPYPKEWKEALLSASKLNGLDLLKLHNDYGNYVGEQVRKFTKGSNKNIDLISSHGHTVFHQPAKELTFQMGSGACIASVNTLTTVCDFRTLDVALHGQGAPLVPLGDMHLFPDYYYCLNLGGFANISYNWHNKRVAYDICPVNIALNYLSRKKAQDYDKDGAMAEKGQLNQKMLAELNGLKYYSKKYPKSLSREWLEAEFLPLLDKYQIPVEDKLHTVCEHIAMQLAQAVKSPVVKKVLVTGGGALNKFLIRLFKQHTKQLVILPNDNLINYKEALIFAYLGLLRFRCEPNCLSSVTGSRLNHAGGVVYMI